MVIVAVPRIELSALDVAVIVTVCIALVAAGAVNVADVAVWLESDPVDVLQLTPAELFVTVALRVVVSVPSTVLALAFTVTVPGTGTEELPPLQPVKETNEMKRASPKQFVNRARHRPRIARPPQSLCSTRLRARCNRAKAMSEARHMMEWQTKLRHG